jgi:hypothetical protein
MVPPAWGAGAFACREWGPFQPLGGTGKLPALLQARPRMQRAQHGLQRVLQWPFPQGHHDAIGFPPQGSRPLHQAAMRIVPTAHVQQPVLDEHRRQFGVQLTEDPPALLGAPFIDLPFVFPEPKEPLDRPSHAQDHQDLWQASPGGGHVGHHQRPARQIQGLRASLSPMSTGLCTHALAPLLGHLFGHPQHQQAYRQASLFAQQHPQFSQFSHLLRQDPKQFDPMTRTRVEGRVLIESHHEPASAPLFGLGELLQALQAEEGQVRQVQPIGWQGLLIERTSALRVPSQSRAAALAGAR